MLEFTGIASVLRGISFLYWLLAFGAVGLALWKGKTMRAKALWAGLAIAAFGFLPVKGIIEQAQREAYAKEAWAYFKKLCDEKSGEKIYKTYTGVKSVLVVKPLPPATEKDLFDQFWYGDPYSASAHSQRGRLEAAVLASPDAPVAHNQLGRGFDFIESVVLAGSEGGKTFTKYFYPVGRREYIQQSIDRPVSRFSLAWDDISTPEDRRYWIAGSRLRVIDLMDNSVVAERIGYFIEAGFGSTAGQRRPWLTSRGPNTTCPYAHTWSDRWFVIKVFDPAEEKYHGK